MPKCYNQLSEKHVFNKNLTFLYVSLKDMKKGIFILFFVFSQVILGQSNYQLAEQYFRNSEYEKAVQLFEALVKKNPSNTNYLKKLINSYQEIGRFDTVETLLQERIQKNPKATYLFVEIGYNYARQQQQELAKTYYDKAIASIQTNPSMGGFMGYLFKENILLDYAITAYQTAMSFNPNLNYQFQVAQLYGEKGDFEKMFTSYVNLVAKNEHYANTVKRLTSRYINDDPENSTNVLFKKALLKKSVSNPKNVWNELLSWLFTQQNEFQKALIQEKALYYRNSGNTRTILILGKSAFDNNRYDTAKECFDFVIANSQSKEQVLSADLQRIQIAIATNQPAIEQLFETTFNTYGKSTATLQHQMAYANYLTYYKNKPQQAIALLEAAKAIAASKFEKAAIKISLGDIYVFTGKYNRALVYFSQVQTGIKNHPLAQQARFKVAQTSYFKHDFKWATAQLKVLKSSTTQLIANDALALFLILSDNQPKDSLNTGLKQYANADLLAFQNKDNQAIDSLQTLITKFKGQDIEDDGLYKLASI